MGSADRKAAGESSPSSGSSSSASDSDVSSEDASSDESDLDKLEAAYTEFAGLSRGLEHIPTERTAVGVTSEDVPGLPLTGGFETLQTLANVLARLTIPLSGFSKQLERLLEGYCLELIATNAVPAQHNGAVRQFAKDLVMVSTMHLSERIASLLRNVMDHPTKVLYDPETEPLIFPQFWVLPLYRELLNTASRCRPSRATELSRGASGLVKVLGNLEAREAREARNRNSVSPWPDSRDGSGP